MSESGIPKRFELRSGDVTLVSAGTWDMFVKACVRAVIAPGKEAWTAKALRNLSDFEYALDDEEIFADGRRVEHGTPEDYRGFMQAWVAPDEIEAEIRDEIVFDDRYSARHLVDDVNALLRQLAISDDEIRALLLARLAMLDAPESV